MNKKDLNFYEAPACEVVELDAKTTLLAGSTGTVNTGTEGVDVETGGNDDSDLFS